ncbi:translesion DNA synthesis-associated protein ImuA [Roseateles sp. P5_E11]
MPVAKEPPVAAAAARAVEPELPVNESSASAGPVCLASPTQNAADTASELPPELVDSVWRASELGRGHAGFVATGFAALDAELPDGGWPCGCMVEILQSQPSLIEWRMVGPSLAPLVKGGRSVVVIGPPRLPHLPGLRHLGLDENCLVWIKADKPSDRLWSAELLLRANAAAAVLAWLPHSLPGQLRRLQVAAQGCEGPVFVFRPLDARFDSSPAPLRLAVSSQLDWQLKVEIVKRRGPAHESPLLLDSVPGGLNHVLTPRMRRPSLIVRSKEVRRHVVGRPHNPAHTAAARLAEEVLARAAASLR